MNDDSNLCYTGIKVQQAHKYIQLKGKKKAVKPV